MASGQAGPEKRAHIAIWGPWLAFGAACLALVAPAFWPRRHRNPGRRRRSSSNPERWVTLRRGRRARIDDEGRVIAGAPSSALGIHVRELSPYWSERRELEATDCRAPRLPATYATKRQALRALLEANPELVDFLEGQGRASTDPALDDIRQRTERPVRTWREGVLAVIPGPSGGRRPRWADLEGRLWILQEALDSSIGWRGGRVAPPAEAIAAAAARSSVAACEERIADAVDDLGSRYAKRGALEAAPF